MAAKKRAKLHQQQPYDSTLKSLFEEQTGEMISFIVEGAEYLQELSGEALKPPLRADRTYLVSNKGEECVAHFELQAGSDSEIVHRLLEYYGILYRKYKKPIISIVIYPFRTTIPKPPLRITNGDREILVFHYRVLALWELEARRYLDQNRIGLYVLLPTMDGATYEVLAQALDEMKEFYADQSRKLATQLLWFGTFLQRTDTVSPEDKRRIEKKMEQFDSLLEQNPFVQKQKAAGIAKGRTEVLQQTLVKFVRRRYPALLDLAQQRAKQIDKPDVLDILIDELFAAPDEEHVRQLLNSSEGL